MRWRDLLRFFVGMVTLSILDAIYHGVRHMPAPNELDHAVNVVLCMGYVMLCAVREERE